MSLRLTLRRERAACVRVRATKHCARFGASTAVALLLMVMALALLPSCGGGGGGAIVAPPPPQPPPAPAPLAITTTTIDSLVGGTTSAMLSATGGRPPYTWSLNAGSQLPPGLTLASSGIINGQVSYPGTSTIVVSVRDSANGVATGQLSIRAAPLLLFQTSGNLPSTTAGSPYNVRIAASGGIPPYRFVDLFGGTDRPPGVTLQNDGTISGTVDPGAVPRAYSFHVQMTDSALPPQTRQNFYTIRVVTQLDSAFFGSTSVPLNRPFSSQQWIVGGQPPYVSQLIGALPSGVSFDPASGFLGGIPTQSGTFFVTLRVTDASSPPTQFSTPWFVQVFDPLAISTTSLPDEAQGVPARGSILVSGGTFPWGMRVISGNLPPGLQLVPTMNPPSLFALSGSATELGVFTFTIEAIDSTDQPFTVTKTLSTRVVPALTFSAPAALPEALEGNSYTHSFSAASGVPPYAWRGLFLPGWLSMDSSSGTLSGTPGVTDARGFSFDVEVSDSTSPPQPVRRSVSLNVVEILRMRTTSLPNVRQGETIRLGLARTGGTPPFQWSVVSGSFPPGVSMNSSGEIVGTPPTVGASSFLVEVRDAGTTFPQVAQQALTLDVVNLPGRNDSIATATPVSNGRYGASISPHVDPIGTAPNPDTDYYRVVANAGAVVSLEVFADRLSPPSPMDSVIQIVDGNGIQFQTCNPFGPVGAFFSACLNDDNPNVSTLDSILHFQVPGAPGTPVTFYVRVLDWSGDARPDFRYEISITGAN